MKLDRCNIRDSTGAIKKFQTSRSRKIILLAVILVVVLTVSVYAYIVSLSPSEGPRVSITSPPFEFSMGIDKSQYAVGGNITIDFFIKNISNDTVTMGKGYEWPVDPSWNALSTEADKVSIPEGTHLLNLLFHFGFAVAYSNGTEVYKQIKGTLPSVYAIVFMPEGSVRQKIIFDTYDNTGNPLPKGTYLIKGIQYCSTSVTTGLITLETPSITFAIN